jgi:UDP-GlcNAc:undecaprenyl-phosphate/decaprenyl-phosphate GlcNAc-1-phosphate transferase
MGHGPRRAVAILWIWTALLSAVVLLPTFTDRGNTLVAPAIVALGLLLYIYFHPGVRSARQEAALTEAADAANSESVVELDRHRRKRASG